MRGAALNFAMPCQNISGREEGAVLRVRRYRYVFRSICRNFKKVLINYRARGKKEECNLVRQA